MSEQYAKALDRANQTIITLRQQVEEVTRIGQQFEKDARQHFDQSCANLNRAITAESELSRAREAMQKISGRISDALGQRHVLEAHRRTIERFHDDPNIKLQDELDVIRSCGDKIHHLLVEAQDLDAAAVRVQQETMCSLCDHPMSEHGKHGCGVPMDSAWTASNTKPCGCRGVDNIV